MPNLLVNSDSVSRERSLRVDFSKGSQVSACPDGETGGRPALLLQTARELGKNDLNKNCQTVERKQKASPVPCEPKRRETKEVSPVVALAPCAGWRRSGAGWQFGQAGEGRSEFRKAAVAGIAGRGLERDLAKRAPRMCTGVNVSSLLGLSHVRGSRNRSEPGWDPPGGCELEGARSSRQTRWETITMNTTSCWMETTLSWRSLLSRQASLASEDRQP